MNGREALLDENITSDSKRETVFQERPASDLPPYSECPLSEIYFWAAATAAYHLLQAASESARAALP